MSTVTLNFLENPEFKHNRTYMKYLVLLLVKNNFNDVGDLINFPVIIRNANIL